MSWRPRTIRMKMVAFIAPGVAALFVVATIVAATMSANAERAGAYREAEQLARRYANGFDADAQTHFSLAGDMAALLDGYSNNDRIEVNTMLQNVMTQHPEILAAYVGYEPNAFDNSDIRFKNQPGNDATGRFIPYWNRLSGTVQLAPLVGYDTAAYYQTPKSTGAETIVEPHDQQGTLIASYVAPIERNGRFIGVAGVDVALSDMDGVLSQEHVFKSGYVFAVSNSGILVSYPQKAAIGAKTLSQLGQPGQNTGLTQIASAVARGESGRVAAPDPLSGKPAMLFYAPVQTGDWGVIVVAPRSEIMSGAQRLRTTLIVVGLLGLLLMVGWIYLTATRLSRPIVALAGAARQLADGDLDATVQRRSDDELGQVADAFDSVTAHLRGVADVADAVARGDLTRDAHPKSERDRLGVAVSGMLRQLRQTIADVQRAADLVAASSATTLDMADHMRSATNEIAGTVQSVAHGSTRQAQQVSAVSEAFEQMNQTVDAVARGAEAQGKTLQRATELAQAIAQENQNVSASALAGLTDAQTNAAQARDGDRTVRGAVQAIGAVRDSVGAAAVKVAEMGERSRQIGAIVKTIEELTQQTNMLALNAAIEAARAGEAGKGFAVVAEEVRKLAERSAASTQQIVTLVHGVQHAVGEAVEAMEAGAAGVDAVMDEADAAQRAFEGILTAAQALEARNREIAAAAETVVARSRELRSRMEETSSIAEENSAAAAQMTATTADVRQGVRAVATVTQQNAAAAEEVSAATEEIAAQLSDVSGSAGELRELAQELQAVVRRFQFTPPAARRDDSRLASAVVPVAADEPVALRAAELVQSGRTARD